MELNKIIDEKIPGRPKFQRREVVVAGESFELYSRDIMECVRALWGDPDFTPHLILEPERHYADDDHTTRIFHEMHTGKWWWAKQVCSGYLKHHIQVENLIFLSFAERISQINSPKEYHDCPHYSLFR